MDHLSCSCGFVEWCKYQKLLKTASIFWTVLLSSKELSIYQKLELPTSNIMFYWTCSLVLSFIICLTAELCVSVTVEHFNYWTWVYPMWQLQTYSPTSILAFNLGIGISQSRDWKRIPGLQSVVLLFIRRHSCSATIIL